MKERPSGNVSAFHTGARNYQQDVQYNSLIERVKNYTECNYILCSKLSHVGIPRAGSKAIYSTVCGGHGAAVRLVKCGNQRRMWRVNHRHTIAYKQQRVVGRSQNGTPTS